MLVRKNIISNYIGQFYNITIGIAMVPYYLTYLGAEAYGLVGFLSLLQSWMTLLDFGVSPTLLREVAIVKSTRSKEEKLRFKSLLHSLEFLFILIAAVASLLIFIYSGWITNKWLKVNTIDLHAVKKCIIIMSMIAGTRFITSLYNSGLSGSENQVWVNNVGIALNTIRSIGVLFVMHYISNDIVLFFEYQLLITCIGLILFAYKFYAVMNLGKFKLYFNYTDVKPIISFATGIAYTGGIWIILSQSDKLLLSNILTLTEYGYFTIVILIANGVQQLISPLYQAIEPRIICLINEKKVDEMLNMYKKASQFMSIFMFSIVGIVCTFSYEIIYAWTNNIKLAQWGGGILFWYVLGNGVLAISGLQYLLQFAYGSLKMHVQYNTIFAIISLPIIIFTAYHYSAIGVAFIWFILRVVSFLVWVPIVHHKFAPGIHKNWLLNDICPILVSSIIYLLIIKYLNLDFHQYGKLFTMFVLTAVGFGLLIFNSLISSEGRNIVFNILRKYHD